MGIYQRDNINYQSMIDNMIRNHNEGARIRSDNLRNQGDIWANVVNNLGQIGAKTAEYYQTRDDQLADAQRAYEQKVAERIAQQKFQKEMQDAQFKHAEALQKAQQLEQKGYKEDEWQRNYELAQNAYNLAKSNYDKDPTAENEALVRNAATNMNYWGGKRGYKEVIPFEQPTTIPTPTPEPSSNPTVPEYAGGNTAYTGNIQKLLDGEWTNESKAKATELLSGIKDKGLQDQWAQMIINKGMTKEQKKAANDKFVAELNKASEGEYTYSGVRQKIIELQSKYPNYNFTLKKGANGKYTIVKGKK